ncbi:M10 family metallopeptidase [Roseicella aquatilis]|uniref:Peptidase metallopeptidase domain-containing protein n=1 Tax=Roseicella aquatilis TaxID=2527868 RepID=A0A4R4DQ51_9PROT|nr:M10 family metallopeptidase [Roseicella aquatilis]TCZ63203.1 hypothetical protein EXY23_10215 [Roseicella aquatilis]
MSNTAALLQIAQPGGVTARWNFTEAVGTTLSAPGGLGSPATVTYSFMQALPVYETLASHPGFLPFDAALQAAARTTLAAWSAVCNISFVEVPDSGAGGVIRFGRNDMTLGGYAWMPGHGYSLNSQGIITSVTPSARAGDVWLSTMSVLDRQEPGSYGAYAMLHEIGHAIGLKHPFTGAVTLPAAENSTAHSVMAYTVPPNMGVVTVTGSPDYYNWTSGTLYPSTPMVEDIAAVQRLYGANLATNAGDTAYRWAAGERLLETIWDGSGNDAIDAGNQLLACVIDLTAGQASSIGIRATEAERRAELPAWAIDVPTPSYDGRNNLWIAEGVTIENAVGGAGADLLIGNDASNMLIGGAGDDTMRGGEGGWDSTMLPGLRSQTSLVRQASGDWVATGPGGHDLLSQIEAVWFEDGSVLLQGTDAALI